MNNLKRHTYFQIIAIMLMISSFLPIVFNNLLPRISSDLIWTIIWLLSLFIFYPQIIKNRSMIYIIAYGFILFLMLYTIWVSIDIWNRNQIIHEFYQIFIASSVIFYYRMEKDYLGLAKLVKWTLIFIVITSVLSIFSSFLDPMYARKLGGISAIDTQSQREAVLAYKRFGVGDYSFASSLVCLFPILIYYYKNNEKSILNKKYLVFFILLLLFTLIRIQIFANIIISVVLILFGILGSKNIKKSIFLIGIPIIIAFTIPVQYYSSSLIKISSLFDIKSEIYYKLNDLATFIINTDIEGSGTGGRIERYPLLWESFINNPILGRYSSETISYIDLESGAHLYWMNKLSVYGLIGTFFFLLILYNHIKVNIKYFDKDYIFYFLLSLFSIFALGFIKAVSGRDIWYMFFIIVPGLYYLPLLKKNKKV